MYSVKVEANFSAAHNLRNYKGKCEALHGHNWKVEVALTGDKLDKAGMVMDFKKLKAELKAVLDKLDHGYLNNGAYFRKVNPTSENIARYIYERLKARLKKLASVTVWESDNCAASYYGE
ncbi:MAG: 6-carboxytetrahydropterin synthase QueD [Candidatus Omnitrophota bacterium]